MIYQKSISEKLQYFWLECSSIFMKDYLIITIISAIIPFLLALLTLTSCGRSGITQDQTTQIEQTATIVPTNDVPTNDSEETENDLHPINPIYGTETGHTIEELSATIVAAGAFWEDWWAWRGPFDIEHIEERVWPRESAVEQPRHPLSLGFRRLLPSSGFTSLDDIESHLLQYYTEAWVYARIISENTVFDALAQLTNVFNPFVEYDGAIFTHANTRQNTNRPNWADATHIIKEQDGICTIVETTVPLQEWVIRHNTWRAPSERIYQFTFIDGRIDEMIHIEDIYDIIAPPVFDDLAVSTPHKQLLAHALTDFFADAEPAPHELELENNTHAILVDVDGNGTPGVIASKWIVSDNYGRNPNASPRLMRKLFYIYEDQLNYVQGLIRAEVSSLLVPTAPGRRLVLISGTGHTGMSVSTYSLLGFIDGELVPVKSIIAVEFRDLPNHHGVRAVNTYVILHDPAFNDTGEIGWGEQREYITKEEFMEIAEQYGLLSIFNNSDILKIPSEADLIIQAP